MILPQQSLNPKIKPKWLGSLGMVESAVAYNCRIHGFPVPVLAMPFWEGAGNKVYDLSGKMNHGTLVNGAKWAGGQFGNALSFDGVNDYVDCGSQSILDNLVNLGNFTFCAQVYMTAHSAVTGSPGWRQRIIIKRSPASMDGWAVRIGDNKELYFSTVNASAIDAVYISSINTINLNQWYHITVVYFAASQSAKLYVNGTECTYSTQTPGIDSTHTDAVGNLLIGASFNLAAYQFWNGYINNPILFKGVALSSSQIRFLHDNPYFMFQPIPVPYGYAAGGNIYSVTLSDNFLLSDMPKKVKEQQVAEVLSILSDTSWKIKEQRVAEPLSVLFDSLKSSAKFLRIFQDSFSNLSDQIYKILNKILIESITVSDTFQVQVAGIIVKLLTDNFLLSDQLTKLLEKKQIESLQTIYDTTKEERFYYQKLLDTLQTLQDNFRKTESKTSADIFANIQDRSSKILLLSILDNTSVLDVFRKEEFKFFVESVVLSDTLIKQIARLLSEQLNISDTYSIAVAAQIIEILLTDSMQLNDLYKLSQDKSIADSFNNLSDTFAAEIVKLVAIVLYMLTDIKDLIGRDTDIKDLIGRDTDIKGH